MPTFRSSSPIVLLVFVLMLGLSHISVPATEKVKSAVETIDDQNATDKGSPSGGSRAVDPVVLFSEGFESGNFNAGPWNAANGWSVGNTDPRTGTYHGNGQAQATNSALTLTRNIDLTKYKNAKISFFQYTVETENTDTYHLEGSRNGGATWGSLGNWNGDNLKTGDYNEYNIDISAYDGNPTFRMRFKFTSSSGAEWWHIDDLILTAVPTLYVEADTIEASPSRTNRSDGAVNITGEFFDAPGFQPFDYNLTIGVIDSKNGETLLIENKTSGNDSLNISKISAQDFRFYFNWSPTEEVIFGRYDVMVKIYGPGHSFDMSYYNDNEANFTLLSTPPYFQNRSVFFDTEPLNALDHRGIPIKMVFYDSDSQDPGDFFLNLYLNGTESNITVFESSSNGSGLNVTMKEDGTYEAVHQWHPENPENIVEGEYRINLSLWEAWGGPLVEMEAFNISQNVTLEKKYVPEIFSLNCEPSALNMTGANVTTINAEFADLDTHSLVNFEVTLKLRDEKNNTVVLAQGLKNGEEGLIIEKMGLVRWQVTLRYDPPPSLLSGPYDIYMGVFDSDSALNFDGFDNNTDELFIYNNTSPTIEEVTLSDPTVNIYEDDTSRLSAVFRDIDGENMGNFTANLSLKDQRGNIHTLVDGELEGPNSTVPHLNPLDATRYVFTYDIDPTKDFMEGEYELFFSISDGWQGRDCLSYGEEDLNLTLFNNAVPSPPAKIWPNSTIDTKPLISWWGSLDEETDFEDLTYSIQIGTSPGGDTVLSWHDNGPLSSYQITQDLGVAVYYIQVKCFDGEFFSEVLESAMTVTDAGNRPPSAPGDISPTHTVRQDPKISWGRSEDPDVNDLIEYFITIGTKWHGSDIIKRTPTSVNTFYQLPFTLEYGIYYIQVEATDGYEFSPIREQAMIIFDPSVNIVPMPPTSLSPARTRNPTPLIQWTGHVDLNNDKLFFWVQIGTSPGTSDLLSWRSTGLDNFHTVEDALEPGTYYVQIKCYDGKEFSDVYGTTLTILAPRAINKPIVMLPTSTTDLNPLINWSGAHYADSPGMEANFSYMIRIGTGETVGDILEWTFIANATLYQVETGLSEGGTYHVQIKATDGTLYSEVFTETLRVKDFNIVMEFEGTSQYILEGDGPQIIEAFIENMGHDEINLTLAVMGSLSMYVELEEENTTVLGGEKKYILLSIEVPESTEVDNSFISLKATSVGGRSVESNQLRFKRESVEEKKWYVPMTDKLSDFFGVDKDSDVGYILAAISIAILTLILLLILIIKLRKRRKKEQFDIDSLKELDNVPIDDLLPTSLYSTFRFRERQGLKVMDAKLAEMFKEHGIKPKPKKGTVDAKALPDGKGEKTPALPPPPPGAPPPEEVGVMPAPGESTALLTEGSEGTAEATPGDVPLATDMEYIPPDAPEGATGKGAGMIVDAEEVPEIPETGSSMAEPVEEIILIDEPEIIEDDVAVEPTEEPKEIAPTDIGMDAPSEIEGPAEEQISEPSLPDSVAPIPPEEKVPASEEGGHGTVEDERTEIPTFPEDIFEGDASESESSPVIDADAEPAVPADEDSEDGEKEEDKEVGGDPISGNEPPAITGTNDSSGSDEADEEVKDGGKKDDDEGSALEDIMDILGIEDG